MGAFGPGWPRDARCRLRSAVQHCADGRLVAYKNKEWLYFNGDGSPLQPPDGRLVDAACGSVPPYTLKIGDKFGLVDARSNPLTPVHFDAVAWARTGRQECEDRWQVGTHRCSTAAGCSSPGSTTSRAAPISSLHRSTASAASCDRTAPGSSSRNSSAARRRDDDTAFVTASDATGVLRLADQSWVVPPRPGVMCGIGDAIVSASRRQARDPVADRRDLDRHRRRADWH